MSQRIERRKYLCISASSTVTDEYTPASGTTLLVEEVGGNASISPDTIIKIVWDDGGAAEEIIFSTHGDATHMIQKQYTGDGSKKLTIKLTNNLTETDCIGGYWKGVLVE